MADDELNAPLGRNSKPKRQRFKLPFGISHVIAVVLALFICACAGWAVIVTDPFGGEPMTVVATGYGPPRPTMPGVVPGGGPQGPRAYDGPGSAVRIPVPPPAQAQANAPGHAPDPAQARAPLQVPAEPEAAAPAGPGRNTVTIIDGSTGKRQVVPIAGSRDARAPVEQRLLETSRHGAIPRVAPDGARPAEAYARPVATPAGKKDAPRVAIVVVGLGVSASMTQDAILRLPGAVTLAFTPYGADVDRAATSARANGHEVMLQAPMEPFDYPDNDPGPQTLLASLPADQNMDRFYWLMSRFQGYVGVVNYMGARFTSTEQAMAPILKETARRGLIFMDDGSSPRSLAAQIASANNLPFAKAEIALDAVPTSAHIDRALTKLEALAREHGSAVGVASALPASIERIAQWAKAAEARGIVLSPISAVAIKPKSS